jgi:hypothetical protein
LNTNRDGKIEKVELVFEFAEAKDDENIMGAFWQGFVCQVTVTPAQLQVTPNSGAS